jgi:hypothetical protein
MSLRKSPELTPELLAAARQNAQHATGPRSPAAKQKTKLNALKHGYYAAPENDRQVMLALGEDPEEFEFLTEQLLLSYGPGDTLWRKQIEDLARLYWRRSRLERTRACVLRRARQAVEEGQHRRQQEIARAAFDASQLEVLELSLPEPAHPDARLRRIVSTLEVVREALRQATPENRKGALPAGFDTVLKNLYQERLGGRAARVCRRLGPYCAETVSSDAQPQRQELLRLLDEEIAALWEEFNYAEKMNQEKAAIEQDACLAPEGETWRMLVRQENALDRAIDRKVRILLSLRKEHSDAQEALRFPPEEPDEAEEAELERLLEDDITSDIPSDLYARISKLTEQSGNVTENKDQSSAGTSPK